MDVGEWVERYRVAWERGDADLAASLFTEDGRYRALIYEEPYQGQEGVRRYWTDVTTDQSDVAVEMGRSIVEGGRVMVEFWTRMTVPSGPVTLAGALILQFADDGRCRDLREYWNVREGRLDPPPGWGA